MKKIIVLTLFTIFLSNVTCYGQEFTDTVTYKIVMKDGSKYIGKILNRIDGVIEFQSSNAGKVNISESDVESITEFDPNSKQWKEQFQSAYYFISPSGYGLKKGEASYHNIYILFNGIN